MGVILGTGLSDRRNPFGAKMNPLVLVTPFGGTVQREAGGPSSQTA
jgi:hypothetical protein